MKRETRPHGRHASHVLPGLLGATLLLTGGSASAVEPPSSTSPVPLELELVDGPLANPTPWEPEASLCDPSPDLTPTQACGQSYVAKVHHAWSDCQPRPPRPGGPGLPPPPPPGMGSRPPGPPPGPPPLPSSGTVDLESTPEPEGACTEGAPLPLRRKATYDVQRLAPDGVVLKVSGTTSFVESPRRDEAIHTRALTFDTTHVHTRAEGQLLRSLHVAGSLEVTFDHSGGAPRITRRGTMSVESAEHGASEVKLNDVVRVAPHLCAWPVSGSLERTTRDGTTQVLSFGPECGKAMLDGQPLTLPARPHGPPGPGGQRLESSFGGRGQ